MILDYVPSTEYFTLRLKRGEADPRELMRAHGLDFSLPASRASEAVLMTKEAYAAASFADVATPAAYSKIGWIVNEVKASWSPTSDAIIKVPADQELWPFQRANVSYALRRRNTLVGDQPGLGKTPTAISFANEIGAKRVLALVPANIRLQWAEKIRQWSTMRWPYVVYPILNGQRGVHPTAEWTIVSYDLARTPAIGAALARGRYDLLILDEAHYLKNTDTGRTRAVFGDHTGWMREPIRDEITDEIIGYNDLFEALASRSERILALTGTPLPNRPREAYTLARGLHFDSIDWMSEDSFKERFNPSMMVEGERKLRDGAGNIVGTEKYVYNREEAGRYGELNNRLRANFMTRHEKRGPHGVAPQLKLPAYDIVIVDETTAVKQALAAESLLHIDPDDDAFFENAHGPITGDIARVRHMMGLAIAPLAADYCKMLLEGGEDKLCIFAYHHDVLDFLQAKLGKFGFIRIDGKVLPKRRQELVNHYIAQPNLRICLGQYQSIGTGTDGLQQVCSHAVFPEFSWVPGENSQAVERLDRMGQARTVLADFMVAKGSLGERMLSKALSKLQETTKVLDKRFY